MAKRSKVVTRAGRTTVTRTSAATTAQGVEQRLGAFAEQLGRMVGTIQAKAENLANPEALSRQLSSVRDGATHMLEQLTASVTTASKRKKTKVSAKARKRRQAPAKPASTTRRRKAAGKRTAKATMKANRRR